MIDLNEDDGFAKGGHVGPGSIARLDLVHGAHVRPAHVVIAVLLIPSDGETISHAISVVWSRLWAR